MAPTMLDYPTHPAPDPPAAGCRYCGVPCPDAYCSWDCDRFDRSSETTWRRRSCEWDWRTPGRVAS